MSSLRGQVAFVTGASGMLGFAIAREASERGAEVRALVRGELPAELRERGVIAVPGDLLDRAALRRGMDGASLAFHVAADVRMYRAVWAEVLRTNVEGTRAVVEEALAVGSLRLVLTSSGSTLGKPLHAVSGEPITIDESNDYASIAPLGMVYPHTKWLSEQEVLRGVERGLDAVITHPTAIFGPWDWKQNLLPLFRGVRGALGVAVPRGWRTVCDVRDVADGHLRAAAVGVRGERYALAGEAMSTRALFTEIATAVGGRAPRFELPPGAMRAIGRASEALAMLRQRAPLLSEEMALQSTLKVRVSSAKAERELGYRCRSARESIVDSVSWYRSRGLL